MSHFAKVENGIVTDIIVAEQDFINTNFPTAIDQWIQTSYNTKGNVHYGSDGNPDGGVALRANYAFIGGHYDTENDVFYDPQPFPSFVLDMTSWTWKPPISYPEDGKTYYWDETIINWVEVTE
jgi:hypothetical protein